MNIIRLTVLLTLLCLGSSLFASAQDASNAEGLLHGLKTWKKIAEHKCTDTNCKDFSWEESAVGAVSFSYIKGYIMAFRVAQIATGREAIRIPDEGIEAETLIDPLIAFLDKNEKARSSDPYLALFLFIKDRYPLYQYPESVAWQFLKELRLDDSSWRLEQEEKNALSWKDRSGDEITLRVDTSIDDFPLPFDLIKLQDAFRAKAKNEKGGIVEVDSFKIANVTGIRVICKYRQTPPLSPTGWTYKSQLIIPMQKSALILQVVCPEVGTTGIRESVVMMIESVKGGSGKNLEEISNAFYKDPYDPRHDKEARFALSDDPKYDNDLADHPLSRCRRKTNALLASLTVGESIRKEALYNTSPPK